MNMTEKQITIEVTRTFKESGEIVREDHHSEIVAAPRFNRDAAVCTVSIDKSLTRNLGNYNSLKIGGFISVPCYLAEDEIERAFKFAGDQVDRAIKNAFDEEGLGK